MNIGLQDASRFFSCMADVAGDLGPVDFPGHERKRRGLGVTRLRLELRPVNRPAVEAGWGTGFQARPLEAECAQLIAEQLRWRFTVAAATVGHLAHMRQAIEERFILDVLENYATYRVYWSLLKKASDDPHYDRAGWEGLPHRERKAGTLVGAPGLRTS